MGMEMTKLVLTLLLEFGILFLIYKTFMKKVWKPLMEEYRRFLVELEKTEKAKRGAYKKIEEILSSEDSRKALKEEATTLLGVAIGKGIAYGVARLLEKSKKEGE